MLTLKQLFLGLLAIAFFGLSAQAATITSSMEGTRLNANFSFQDGELGGPVNVYMAAKFEGKLYLRGNGLMDWRPYDFGALPVAATLNAGTRSADILVADFDLSKLPDIEVLVAYGRDQSEILEPGRVAKIYPLGNDGVPKGSGKMSFRANGALITTDVWSFSYIPDALGPGRTLFNITSNMHIDTRMIGFNFEAPAVGKKMQFFGDGFMAINYGSYRPVHSDIFNIFSIVSGSLTFTSFDTGKGLASGSFEFVTRDSAGNEVLIRDGQFSDAKLKKEVSP